MKIHLLWVGKPHVGETDTICRDYLERIRRFGIDIETGWVKETPAGGRYSENHCMEREAALLLEKVDHRCTMVALHRTGRQYDSSELANRLEKWAAGAASFVIGGPLGLHSTIIDRADQVWSLSNLTFPHELARVVVAEQIYRAITILRGVPYHK